MVTHGHLSGVLSRIGVRPGGDAERLKRFQIAVQNATAYQRLVPAKGAGPLHCSDRIWLARARSEVACHIALAAHTAFS
jgi:hypothetical protein